ncbi:hydroxyacid dehydrogenase [Pantoea dispersa]|uniref:hydroxyacid dehydrogenase n=1 Tax=Pantoea dispersa TaxID=59814 RepID=UPI0021CAA66C|nr:hydroxyacid dehydrogenase [Pantoea dispersa]UXO70960.1 hydroxyacid dehydrogenase [Pantoea dispersa]
MSNVKTILITGSDLAAEAVELLQDYQLIYAGRQPQEADLIALCERHNPQAIIVRYGKINGRIMDAAPALRVISKHGSGIDVIDQQAAAERQIAVRAAVGANAAAVSEHAWALILACAKSVSQLDRRMRDGHWDKAQHKSLELEERTLGLVGLGAIGSRVARIGQAFGMQVLAYDPYAQTLPAGCEAVESLDELYSRADVVSLHCPLTDSNHQMINAAALARFKPGAILVNTARGGLIDDQAVATALQNGTLRAAGLDSFTSEPLNAPHLWQSLNNVIITPHIGGVSDNAYVRMGTGAARNALQVLQEQEAVS